MNLQLYRATWGMEMSWATLFSRVAVEGYAGIEAPLIHLDRHLPKVPLEPHGLGCIPMIFTEGENVAAHLASFQTQLESCVPYQPPLVNCHSGYDGWTEDESIRFFEAALAIEADLGVLVAHETHRGRILYNPWTTLRMVERFDALKLCCDFSHWVCVCERLLPRMDDLIAACALQALHIHARVGYEEGPQVPDPRAPEYRRHLEAHEAWWDAIWSAQQQKGMETITLTPEFGPPPYLHSLPYTKAPVADLWEICSWQGQRQAERFAKQFGA